MRGGGGPGGSGRPQWRRLRKDRRRWLWSPPWGWRGRGGDYTYGGYSYGGSCWRDGVWVCGGGYYGLPTTGTVTIEAAGGFRAGRGFGATSTNSGTGRPSKQLSGTWHRRGIADLTRSQKQNAEPG
jgi:hypothetical protein